MDDIGATLNRLAREQLKLKLMLDIRMDIEVCMLEGLYYKDYLIELKSIIDAFMTAGEEQMKWQDKANIPMK